jgi:hypothetical protein
MDQEQQIRLLIDRGLEWLREQRQLHRPGAHPLEAAQREAFVRFFPAEMLEEARFKTVPLIQNPPFYKELGIPAETILDWSSGRAVTFHDTVLLSKKNEPPPAEIPALLFHELVHVAQYQVLGIHGFANRYVRGWVAADMRYEAIPIESHAEELSSRFSRNPDEPFEVLREIDRRATEY